MAVPLFLCAVAGCATTPRVDPDGRLLRVVAAESVWGSLAAQLGGSHVTVTSIVDNPGADPHDYEPTTADARAVALAGVVVLNGVGYDPWATRLAAANRSPRQRVLTVGDVVGAPAGANPHRWYNPDDVRRVIAALTVEYQRADPADAGYFDRQRDTLLGTGLKGYFDRIERIRAVYRGTPVGASESIFAMLAPALGLDLITPPSFLAAISEGSDPTARDTATADAQLTRREVAVYVYNSQNTTPDVRAQIAEATAAGVPVTTITETPTPAGASFQDWQVAQLDALHDALARATGR